MNWTKYLNYFILVPILAGLLGNFSLGIIIVGLTGLIWGLESGVLFISLTTTLLVILTGNINMEIIFLFILTLAYLNREYKILNYLDARLSYFILFIISISSYPFWKYILGIIPVRLLNELNIAGEVLVVAGLFLFLVRGKVLLQNSVQRKIFFKYILFFACPVLGLMGNFLLIPLWILGVYFIERFEKNLNTTIIFERERYILFNTLILLLATIAVYVLLPIGFIAGLVLLLIFAFIFRNIKQVPLVEMVYFSMIVGIVAGRMGLLL